MTALAKTPGKPIQRRLHGSIADELGAAIVLGVHPAGHILAGEIEASGRLGVSRSAYREALRMLSAKGLVESRPKTGTWVTNRAKWHLLDPDVIRWIFSTDPPEDLIEGVFELRMVLEPAAAAYAAARRTQSQLDAMEDALARMTSFTLAADEGRKADNAFHRTLLEATANPLLITLSGSISAAIQWTSIYKMRANKLPSDPVPFHALVFDAIREQDSERARSTMQTLIQIGLDETLLARPGAHI